MECCGEERSPGRDRCCLAINLLWGICRRVWGGPEGPGYPDTAGGSWRRFFSGTEAARDPVVHTERQNENDFYKIRYCRLKESIGQSFNII